MEIEKKKIDEREMSHLTNHRKKLKKNHVKNSLPPFTGNLPARRLHLLMESSSVITMILLSETCAVIPFPRTYNPWLVSCVCEANAIKCRSLHWCPLLASRTDASLGTCLLAILPMGWQATHEIVGAVHSSIIYYERYATMYLRVRANNYIEIKLSITCKIMI